MYILHINPLLEMGLVYIEKNIIILRKNYIIL